MEDLGIKVAFVTAEQRYAEPRRTIARVFGCAVANEYGARDAGLEPLPELPEVMTRHRPRVLRDRRIAQQHPNQLLQVLAQISRVRGDYSDTLLVPDET